MTVLITSIATNSWAVVDHDRPRRRRNCVTVALSTTSSATPRATPRLLALTSVRTWAKITLTNANSTTFSTSTADQNRSGTVGSRGARGDAGRRRR